jgi:hypothetical protein
VRKGFVQGGDHSGLGLVAHASVSQAPPFFVNGAKSWFTVAFPEFRLFLLGALFIAVTLFLPDGLMGLASGEVVFTQGVALYLDDVTVSFDGFKALQAEPGHKQSSGLFVPGEGSGHGPDAPCKGPDFNFISAMQSGLSYKPRLDKSNGHVYLRGNTGKCLHCYFYFIDEEFGLCLLRVPT